MDVLVSRAGHIALPATHWGAFMTLRLRNEDRRAVDLLLDRAATGSGTHATGAGNGSANSRHPAASFTPVSGGVQARLPAVQKVLQVLDMLPAEEPPQDLLGRTLRRLDAEQAKHPSTLRPPQPALGGTTMHQPHA
jgi:hypothetical protein